MSYLKVLYEGSEVVGIQLVSEKDYHDLVREDEVKDGDILYVVIVQYSTGNSFGRESGLIEAVDTFKTLEKARTCLEAVKRSDKTYKHSNRPLKYIMDNGRQFYTEYTSWNGFFDSLDDVYIKQLVVGNISDKIR